MARQCRQCKFCKMGMRVRTARSLIGRRKYFCINPLLFDIPYLDVVKARHEAVKIEKTELEVARMRGALIDVQDVKRLWGDIANTVMQNMIHLASKIAPMLRMMDNTEVIANLIDTEVRKTLTDIANTPLPSYAADESETEESEEEDDEEV